MNIKKPVKKKREYVNNKMLYEHLVVYHKEYKEAKANGTELPRLPEYVGHCILLVTNRVATKRNFKNYSFIAEMISDAIENAVMYIHNFDPAISTQPFAYITRITMNAFIRRISEEEKHQYRLLSNSQRHMVLDQLNPDYIVGGDHSDLYDNLNQFIKDFERKNGIDNTQIKKKSKAKTNQNELAEFWN